MSAKSKAREFLLIAPQFKLGHLVTESFHPMTRNLSQLVHKDVGEALAVLQVVDREALSMMKEKSGMIWQMAHDIQATLKAGNKVFM
jgi:hypothetical protein